MDSEVGAQTQAVPNKMRMACWRVGRQANGAGRAWCTSARATTVKIKQDEIEMKQKNRRGEGDGIIEEFASAFVFARRNRYKTGSTGE